MIIDKYGKKFGSYKDYLKYSKHWKEIRNKKRTESLGRCDVCKKIKYQGSLNDIDIHHLHYETVGNERMQDLKAVCRNCHSKEDNIRETRKYYGAVATYAEKKYGYIPDDLGDVAEEFNDWVESKQ